MNKTVKAVNVLARRLIENPQDTDAELCIKRMERRYGDWVVDLLVDCMTKGTEGTYPQTLQDKFRTHGQGSGDEATAQRIPVASLIEDGEDGAELSGNSYLISMISDLTPSDFYRIPSEARLSHIERQVWGFFVRGYSVPRMVEAELIVKKDGECYRLNSVYKILHRAQEKVLDSPSIGWRTALAEDIARGKDGYHPPARVSFVEVCRN